MRELSLSLDRLKTVVRVNMQQCNFKRVNNHKNKFSKRFERGLMSKELYNYVMEQIAIRIERGE